MKPLDMESVRQFVNENIVDFHAARARSIASLKLKTLLKKKNPYLFRAKNLTLPETFVESVLAAHISSSEEEIFGNFLERLAIFIGSQTCDAQKSNRIGIDMEFIYKGVHNIVQIKSSTNWGNSSQQKKLADDFRTAIQELEVANPAVKVQAVLGSCYGKSPTNYTKGYLRLAGQSFWYFISENADLYTDIIEPIGYLSEEHNLEFARQRDKIIFRFTREMVDDFCNDDGVDWEKVVAFNSGNLELP